MTAFHRLLSPQIEHTSNQELKALLSLCRLPRTRAIDIARTALAAVPPADTMEAENSTLSGHKRKRGPPSPSRAAGRSHNGSCGSHGTLDGAISYAAAATRPPHTYGLAYQLITSQGRRGHLPLSNLSPVAVSMADLLRVPLCARIGNQGTDAPASSCAAAATPSSRASPAGHESLRWDHVMLSSFDIDLSWLHGFRALAAARSVSVVTHPMGGLDEQLSALNSATSACGQVRVHVRAACTVCSCAWFWSSLPGLSKCHRTCR